ncbi:MAG: hypothetical protein HY581_02820 [Nitrospirae bacterium]|nr:hypothetical protein [Nitrospirota bacterium]
MHTIRTLALAVTVGLFVFASQAGAADQKVTLMLGGKFCEFYPEAIQTALQKVDGVKSVDLKSMKGHAVVQVEADKVRPGQLTDAVNAVKGDGWHCKAEVMK